jgi:hypothetical protein
MGRMRDGREMEGELIGELKGTIVARNGYDRG